MSAAHRSSRDIAEDFERVRQTDRSEQSWMALLHEIQVYQEELLVQNEELTVAQRELEETRDRFVDLYESAPNGYLTLDENGIVLQLNAAATVLLGRDKSAIEGLPLLGFFASGNRALFLNFMRRCRSADDGAMVEAELRFNGEPVRHVQLLCRPRTVKSSGTREFLTAMVDITDRKRLERERAMQSQQYAALASRLIAVQDEERHRISRDLHDDIGQQLTALRLGLETASRDASGASAAAIRDARTLLETLDRRLHFLAAELRPASLNLGLSRALEQFTRDWSEVAAVPAAFDGTALGSVRLEADVETHIYRVAQEALNNVAKHARPSNVSVVLERHTDVVLLVVEDDGRGFDIEHAQQNLSSMGLIGMRERAHLVGGSLEIESSPGHGTTIFMRVPFRPLRAPVDGR